MMASAVALALTLNLSISRREGFESVAFTPEEHSLLSSLDAPTEEWFLRLWCAKEAVAKATGRGLVGGPGGLKIQAWIFIPGWCM